MVRNCFIVLLIMLALQSCSKPSFYEKIHKFDDRIWKESEVAEYNVDIKDTMATYQFVLTLRTTTDYQYNNLWVFWTTTTPDGEVSREPFQIVIADEAGNWMGKKSGSIVENQLTFNVRKMPKPGKYKFRIEQAVTADIVDEVLDLGLVIEKK